MQTDTEKKIREILEDDPQKAQKILDTIQRDENERRLVRHKRQMEGIELARQKNVALGRPKKPLPDGFDQIYRDVKQQRRTKKEIAVSLGMSVSNLNVLLRRYKEELEQQSTLNKGKTGPDSENILNISGF